MKEFRRGERVKFLSETGAGVVEKIGQGGIVIVLTDDGFEVPVSQNELIRTEAYDSSGNPVNAGKKTENPVVQESVIEEVPKPIITDGVVADIKPLLKLVAEYSGSGTDSSVSFSLSNPGPARLFVTIGMRTKKGAYLIGQQLLHPRARRDFQQVPAKRFREGAESLFIQAVAMAEGTFQYLEPASFVFTFNDMKDSMTITWPDNSQAFNKLLESNLNATLIVKDKEIETPRKAVKPEKMFPGVEEVDLHIGSIMENHKHLNNAEITDIQISRFRTALDGAIKARQSKIVFIHGVGEGKLKYRIRRLIDSDYKGCSYQDASFTNYGYGATLVHIK